MVDNRTQYSQNWLGDNMVFKPFQLDEVTKGVKTDMEESQGPEHSNVETFWRRGETRKGQREGVIIKGGEK